MSRLALVTAFALALLPAVSAQAASKPSGSISCPVFQSDQVGFEFNPFIRSTTTGGRILVKANMAGDCDNSGVVGGKAPILSVTAKLIGSLTAGTTCSSFVDVPTFDRLKIKIKWKTTDVNGRQKVVASSSASFVGASIDGVSEALVLASQPLKGAFAGSTSTVKITFDDIAFLDSNCPPIASAYWGADGESSITIP